MSPMRGIDLGVQHAFEAIAYYDIDADCKSVLSSRTVATLVIVLLRSQRSVSDELTGSTNH